MPVTTEAIPETRRRRFPWGWLLLLPPVALLVLFLVAPVYGWEVRMGSRLFWARNDPNSPYSQGFNTFDTPPGSNPGFKSVYLHLGTWIWAVTKFR